MRYVSIWFRYLATDWFSLRRPERKHIPFVLRTAIHGRMVITASNAMAEQAGIYSGTVLADARAAVPDLHVDDDNPSLREKLLQRLAAWCIRFTPVVAIDLPDGLLLDATGCTHLWGGDEAYLFDIQKKLNTRGYEVRVAMADTIGTAWALARYGETSLIASPGKHVEALLPLPPEALRLEAEHASRLHKLGLHQVRHFINMPRISLRRRFGNHFLLQLDRAIGQEFELLDPVQPPEPYHERLPAPEPIITAAGIEIALHQLLTSLCMRLQNEQKGVRRAAFKCYRVDGKIVSIEVGTNAPSNHRIHLYKLFEIKLHTLEPAAGIDLFVLEASHVEEYLPSQSQLWSSGGGLYDKRLVELLDRVATKTSIHVIHRYMPTEHYWPERSYRPATTLHEQPTTDWRSDVARPIHLLPTPEPIDVSAPIPDYPPMLFRYKGAVHKIIRADGPERIEQEWWLQQGQHRDYYCVEDEEGRRYWLFRSGHYHDKLYKWFLHGFFA